MSAYDNIPILETFQIGKTYDITFNIRNNESHKITVQRQFNSGTFGFIYEAEDEQKNKYAIKATYIDPNYYQRELDLTILLKDTPFIVKAYAYWSCYIQKDNIDKKYLYILMDKYNQDLNAYIEKEHKEKYAYSKINQIISTQKSFDRTIEQKLFAYQWLRGLAYIHMFNICDRDIKTYNILVNQNGKTVLCDLGSAKILGEFNISYICTRNYRAPELSIGSTKYSTKVDVFSLAVVIVEYDIQKRLFNSANGQQHMQNIMNILGTPTKEDIESMHPEHPWSTNYKGQNILRLILNNKDEDFLDLIQSMMRYNQYKRITCFQALAHKWFNEIRALFKNNQEWKYLFEFTEQEQKQIIKECGQEKLKLLLNQ